MAAGTRSTGLSQDVDENCRLLAEALGQAPDLIRRRLRLGPGRRIDAAVCFLAGLSSSDYVSEHVIFPILQRAREGSLTRSSAYGHVLAALDAANDIAEAASLEEVVRHVVRGSTVIFVAGARRAIVVASEDPPHRGVMEPESEALVRGPRDGFTESLAVTVALIRNRVRTPALRLERLEVGKTAPTAVAVAYLDDRVDPDVLDAVLWRIRSIDADTLSDTGELGEFLSDQRYPVFPTILMTERPDRVAAGLMEGKVAVAVDGSPVVLLAPNSFWDFLMSPEDYYQNPFLVTLIRWVRVASFLIAMLLPSLYVAATSFHHEMIPTTLALRIAAGREGTAFPAVVEALLLEAQFELLREAGLRIPRKIGTAVSIVGVLVIGQALVAAGVVSPIMITVVGATAVSSFAVPIFAVSAPARLLRFPLMLLAGSLGVYGVVLGTFVIFAHAASLKSFGRPYLTPIAPLRLKELADSPLYRAPRWIPEHPGSRRRSPQVPKAQRRSAGCRIPRHPAARRPGAPPDKERLAASDRLSAREVAALLAMMYSAPLVFSPIYMFLTAGRSAWLSGLLSGVAGVVIVLLWARLCAWFPGRTLPEIVDAIAGRTAGWFINLVFALYFLLETGVSARMIGEVMLQILSETPPPVLMALALAAGAAAARLGPQALGRVATVHVGVASGTFVITLVTLASLIDGRNFLPVLVDGWAPVLRGASRPVALLGHVALLAFLLPLTRDDRVPAGSERAPAAPAAETQRQPAPGPPDPGRARGPRRGSRGSRFAAPSTEAQAEYFRRGLWAGAAGMGFSWLAFYVMLLLEQGVFSAEEASRLTIPALAVARAIDVGVFFERVEVLLIALWTPAVMIKMCLFMYSAAKMIDHLVGTRDAHRHYVIPVAAAAMPAALTNAVDLLTLVRVINGVWAAMAILVKEILPLGLLCVHLVQRRVARARRTGP